MANPAERIKRMGDMLNDFDQSASDSDLESEAGSPKRVAPISGKSEGSADNSSSELRQSGAPPAPAQNAAPRAGSAASTPGRRNHPRQSTNLDSARRRERSASGQNTTTIGSCGDATLQRDAQARRVSLTARKDSATSLSRRRLSLTRLPPSAEMGDSEGDASAGGALGEILMRLEQISGRLDQLEEHSEKRG